MIAISTRKENVHAGQKCRVESRRGFVRARNVLIRKTLQAILNVSSLTRLTCLLQASWKLDSRVRLNREVAASRPVPRRRKPTVRESAMRRLMSPNAIADEELWLGSSYLHCAQGRYADLSQTAAIW